MWNIEDIAIRDAQLDFTSSGGDRFTAQAVYADNTQLINAIGFVHFDEDPTQLIVCESCGHTQCESGGWVQIRRLGSSVVLIPAFDRMLEGEFELTEFAPPSYLSSRGVPFFAPHTYANLRNLVSSFPPSDKLPRISASDAIRLIQWQAPSNVLGEFPETPTLRRRHLLAVTDGDLDEQCDIVQQFLNTNITSDAELSEINVDDVTPIEFHLDDRRCTAWRPMGLNADSLVLNIEPEGKPIPPHQCGITMA